MKAKTLIKAMMYPVDVVDIYTDTFQFVTTVPIEDFQRDYAENRIIQFNITETNDGVMVLEVVMN